METFTVRDLTFTYPGKDEPALRGLSFSVNIGEMITVCGRSGSGKSTLLKSLKPIMAPHGRRVGEVLFYGSDLYAMDNKTQAARIGYVLQNPDAQIVTDKVWHELAFGLEGLGIDTKTIRLRVAEMASFFGIQTWFHKDVDTLSGGQKQLLNLASVMAMQPDVLILDEPTSQLDPIAADDFLDTVKKINRELGTTVIITEHRLEEVIPMSDKVMVLENGEIIAYDTAENTGAILASKGHPMFMAMPTPLQAYSMLYGSGIGIGLKCPVDVRGGRNWLTELFRDREIKTTALPAEEERIPDTDAVLEMKDVWFRYDRQKDDVIKDLSLRVYQGELFCIVGGNGTGKSTALALAGGIRKPYRGSVKIKGRALDRYKKGELFNGTIGMLPQNPQSLFVEKTLRLDLLEIFEDHEIETSEKERRVNEVAELVEIEHLLEAHPYDLSGGEQQRAALAKVLLLEPEILFLDEPTKGLDNSFKSKLAGILRTLLSKGVTVIMVSHDVEFCGRYGSRCAMFFDGKIITTNAPRRFFSGNSFYTTAANRMSRHIFENVVNVDDIVDIVEANISPGEESKTDSEPPEDGDGADDTPRDDGNAEHESDIRGEAQENIEIADPESADRRHGARKWCFDLIMLAVAAVTVAINMEVSSARGTMVTCLLMILYSMIFFFARFERKRPQARELVLLTVMISIAVVSRVAFFMLPNFKPMLAIVIISGAAFGRESGFLVGAMSAFISNFMFGQGPWTPWQMIAMALTGYLSGLLFSRFGERFNRLLMLAFGAFSAFFIYSALSDIWSIFMVTEKPDLETILMVYTAGAPFAFVHAAATVIFLFILAGPMIGKLERMKLKYGIG